MIDDERLSRYIDGDLSPDEAADVARELEADPDARDLESRLRSTKAAIGSADITLDAPESRRLDAAVQRALDDSAGAAPDAARPPKASPRKRGRAPAPYFAAAAVIAVLLLAGLSVLASSLFQSGTDDALTTTGEEDPERTAPGGSPRGDEQATEAPPEGHMQADGSEAADGPALFVSDVALSTEGELRVLLDSAPHASVTRSVAIEELVARGDAVGLANLRVCLESIPTPFAPTSVQRGTWRDEPAYFIAGASAGSGSSDRVVVLDADSCAVLAETG